MTDDRLRHALALSPRFYDAALDHAKWPGVLRELRRALGAEIVQLNIARISTVTLLLSFDDGMTDAQRRVYLRYRDFATNDPRLPHIVQQLYRPHHCREFLTETEWHASPTYKALHAPWGYDYTLWYHVPNEDRDLMAILAFTRLRSSGAFTEDDTEHLSLYVPHLRRALDVTMALVAERARHGVFARALDMAGVPVVIADRFARPLHTTPAARSVLDAGRALHVDGGGLLRAAEAAATERLRDAMLETGVAAMAGRPMPPVEMTLPAADGGAPLYASVSSLSGTAQEAAGLVPDSALVGLFLNDPARRVETDTERLQRLFGLTTTEAIVLGALAETGSARKVAQTTGRGYETVRKHIKVIREKLGASSQVDLVRLVAQSR